MRSGSGNQPGRDREISRAGIVALSGYIESTEGDDTVEASCIWADSVYWDEIMSPAREWVRGTYPEKENEVMATEEGLEKAGLSDLLRAVRTGSGNLPVRDYSAGKPGGKDYCDQPYGQ